MPILRQGINTGLLGYSLRKEFLGESLYLREIQTFSYEIFALDMASGKSENIERNIYNEFRNKYSGDIFVKSFEIPSEYNFPNDHIHVGKFRVAVEVRNSGSSLNTDLTGSYYSGLNSTFWSSYGRVLDDFKEEFTFETQDNGNEVFGHDINFSLLTGNRATAVSIASGIFAQDRNTNFGIATMVGIGAQIADTNNYQDFYTEVYDEIRQAYRFNKRREIFPFSGTLGGYALSHVMDFKEDGTFDVLERGNVQGKLTFSQAQQTTETLITGAYNRCNSFYTTYNSLATSSPYALITLPVKLTKNYNRQSFSSDYEVLYTTNPTFNANGVSIDELFDFEANEINIATFKHNLNFSANRRVATTDFATLINNAVGYSPTRANNYYATLGALYSPTKPLKQIRQDMSWPNRTNKASASFEYSNHPRYFTTINGVTFYFVDYKVQNVKPVDIINEYKIINRPSKSSVINYAYQTEKGQIVVTLDGSLGRNANEFMTGFRSGYSASLLALYKFGIQVFMEQFFNTIPTSFTYFLADLKYSLNQDGILNVMLTFSYTLKKYTI
jgi:hypothetical protein